MAMNAADPHHYSFNEALLPLAVEKQMGIIGMKIPGRGRILSTWTPPPIEQQKHSWEGMTIQTSSPGTLKMREAMYYTLSRPVSTVIIGCDTIAQLEENVQLAREFTPMNEKQQTELVATRRTLRQAIAVLPLLRPSLTTCHLRWGHPPPALARADGSTFDVEIQTVMLISNGGKRSHGQRLGWRLYLPIG